MRKPKTQSKSSSRAARANKKPSKPKKASGVSVFEKEFDQLLAKELKKKNVRNRKTKKNLVGKVQDPLTRIGGSKEITHAYKNAHPRRQGFKITRGEVSKIKFRRVNFRQPKRFETIEDAEKLFEKFVEPEFLKFAKQNGTPKIYAIQYKFKFPNKKLNQFRNVERKKLKNKTEVSKYIYNAKMMFLGSMATKGYLLGEQYLRFSGFTFECF